MHAIANLNCSELISLELGLINASKTLVGLVAVATDRLVTKLALVLYFMKKTLPNSDGGTDLVTVVALAHHEVNKALVLSVLKKIVDKYFEFHADLDDQPDKTKLGEFKLYMNQIIKFEEMQYDARASLYSYGATEARDGAITPNQLVAAANEADEVRLLMLSNITKILGRGDRISAIVDNTELLQGLALIFQKRLKAVLRRVAWSNMRFVMVALVVSAALFVYLFFAFECGPLFQHCWH